MLEETIQASPEPAKRKKKQRIENDLYPTNDWVTEVFLDELGGLIHPSHTVFECCAGHHAISKFFPGCTTNEISGGSDFSLDASLPESWGVFGKHDWVITNPPFSLAPQILPLAFEYSNLGVIFLLRITYMEAAKNRGAWLQANCDRQTHQLTINPRASFRADGGKDTATVAWFVWQKQWSWSELGIKPPFLFFSKFQVVYK